MPDSDFKLKPIEKKSLHLKISDAIYNYIRKNKLGPGDKLPSERDMASMLQTSRHTVREALRILEDRGVIYVKTGSGAFVKDQYGDESVLSLRLTGCSINEIQELQSTLEHQVVLNAMYKASVVEQQELISIATEMVELAKDDIYSHTLDHSFHSKLYECGYNKAIKQLLNQVRDNRFIQRESANGGNDTIWLATIKEHLDLATAIYKKDKDLAFKAIDIINDFGFNLLK